MMLYIFSILLLSIYRMEFRKCDGPYGTVCCNGFYFNKAVNECSECSPGFYGLNCSSKCSPPRYGKKCQFKCNCADQACHFSYGCFVSTANPNTYVSTVKTHRNSKGLLYKNLKASTGMTPEEEINTGTSSKKATETVSMDPEKFLSGSSMYILTGCIGLFVLFFCIYVIVSVYKKIIHVRTSRSHIVQQLQKDDLNYTALHTRLEIQPHVAHFNQHRNSVSYFSPVFDDDINYEEIDIYNSADESSILESYQLPSEFNNDLNPHTHLSHADDSYLTPVADAYLTPVDDAYSTPVKDVYLTPVEDVYLTPVKDAHVSLVEDARHVYIDVIE